ncbi:hypothetical protein [Enterobacter hormaechei]|uniref:hypothetical protein n=1 Tax=Enterobacter hormaechei TaxID=158836 RepID=UPI0039065F07
MSNIDKQALTLKERIEKALSDFTKGRASMHVPPLDTDVDMVLADCLTALEKLEATAAQANAGWKEAHEQEARAEAAEKQIAEQRGIILSARNFISEYADRGDVGAEEFVSIVDRAAGTAKGE